MNRNQWVCLQGWSEGQFSRGDEQQWWMWNEVPATKETAAWKITSTSRWRFFFSPSSSFVKKKREEGKKGRAVGLITIVQNRDYCQFNQKLFCRMQKRGFVAIKKSKTRFVFGESAFSALRNCCTFSASPKGLVKTLVLIMYNNWKKYITNNILLQIWLIIFPIRFWFLIVCLFEIELFNYKNALKITKL